MEVSGRRVLLTGASGGLGQETARVLADRGATLLLSGRDKEQLEQLARDLPGDSHEVLVEDLSQPGIARLLVERAGHVDVLIANAGVSTGILPHDDDDLIESVVRVNFTSPVELVNAVLPQMHARGSGQIVLISSLAAKATMSDLYSSTKAGLRAFAWSMRPRLARSGIAVTLITPGFIADAGMFARDGKSTAPGLGAVPLKRYAKKLAKAIERERAEAVIAPPLMRMLCQVAIVWPGLVAKALSMRSPGALVRGR